MNIVHRRKIKNRKKKKTVMLGGQSTMIETPRYK